MRRLIALAAVAASAFGVAAPAAPASAAYQCYGVYSGTQRLGVCAGSWCPDVCFIVAYVECEGHDARVCRLLNVGSRPGS